MNKFNKTVLMYSGVLLSSLIVGGFYVKDNMEQLDLFDSYIEGMNINNSNSQSLFNSMKDKAEYLNNNIEDNSIIVERADSNKRASRIESADIRVLSLWSTYEKPELLFYTKDNSFENEVSTSDRDSTYIEGDNGDIVEIPNVELGNTVDTSDDAANEEPETTSNTVETFGNNEETVTETETKTDEDNKVDKTFIIIRTAGFDTESELTFKIYDKDTDEELTSTSTVIGGQGGYNSYRIDLIEVDGGYYTDDLKFEVLNDKGNTSGLHNVEFNDLTDDELNNGGYSIMEVNGDRLVIIKDNKYSAGNRIELVRTTKFGEVVIRDIEETVRSTESSTEAKSSSEVESVPVESTLEFGPVAPTEPSLNITPSESYNSNIFSTEESNNEESESSSEVETEPRIVESNDEMYHMVTNYTVWGNPYDIKDIVDSNIHFYDSLDRSEVDFLDSFQVKWNTDTINEDEVYLSSDFSVSIKVLKSNLDNYMTSTHRENIYGSTISEIKSKFSRKFKLMIDGDNGIEFDF